MKRTRSVKLEVRDMQVMKSSSALNVYLSSNLRVTLITYQPRNSWKVVRLSSLSEAATKLRGDRTDRREFSTKNNRKEEWVWKIKTENKENKKEQWLLRSSDT